MVPIEEPETIRQPAALLSGQEPSGRTQLTAEDAAAIASVLEETRTAGWSGAYLGELVLRALAAPGGPAERRAAFWAHLQAMAARRAA